MSNYDKQYEEDLERAQALSLESLALEQFKNKKRLQELTNKLEQTNAKQKNISVARASSMNETDSVQIKYDRCLSRPRPGGSTNSGGNSPAVSLIAPPPSTQRKSSSASSISDSPDLISFTSPPATTNNIIEFCNRQNYSSNQIVSVSPMIQQPQTQKYWPQMSQVYYPTRNAHQSWCPPQYNHPSFQNVGIQSPVGSPNVLPIGALPSPIQNLSVVQNIHSGVAPAIAPPAPAIAPPAPAIAPPAPAISQIPPALPPKNKQRTPPPIQHPSSSLRIRRQQNSNNLIDLAQSDDKNSVRVSILQEFDPILSDADKQSTYRTISPDCSVDDSLSICDSVYDEYDPYDFIYSGSGNNSLSDPLYAAVLKSETAPQSPAPPVPPRARMSTIDRRSSKYKEKWNLLDNIQHIENRSGQSKDSDLKAFYKMVYTLRNKFKYNDPDTNMGLVISPMVNYKYEEGLSIKLCVYPDFEGADFNKTTTFTCDVTSSVEHVTLQLTYGLEAPSKDQYTLKVWGYNEYLVPTTFLSDYEYVHNCIKLDEDVVLVLIPDSKVDKSFARSVQDDNRVKDLRFEDVVPNNLHISHENLNIHINHENLTISLETVESEMSKLEQAALQLENHSNPSLMPSLQPSKVVQSVKWVINQMQNICTLDIMESVDSLRQICEDVPQSFCEVIRSSCNRIRLAIQNLIEMYCQVYTVDFEIKYPNVSPDVYKSIQDVSDDIVIRICAIYRPSIKWKHDSYIIAAQIYHGMRPMGQPVLSQPSEKQEQDQSWPSRIVFDHWFQVDVPINSLARESRLVLVVYGRTLETNTENEDNSATPRYQQEEIGWASVQFFNYEGIMAQGSMLLSIWPKETSHAYGPAPAAGVHPDMDHPMVGVEIAVPTKLKFPQTPSDLKVPVADFQTLDAQTQQQLLDIFEHDMLYKLPLEIREVLWEKRHYLYQFPEALPKVLLAAHSWSYSCLTDLHGMLHNWKPLKSIDALQLLLPTFPDIEVRKMAVKWIHSLTNDELVDYLPQLVVALKLETYENSELAKFLLDRSLRSPRFAHYLFWLLSHNLPGGFPQNCVSEISLNEEVDVSEVRHHRRMKLLLRALLEICGESLRNCFLSQQFLTEGLNEVAEMVQNTKESHRNTILQNKLHGINDQLMDNPTSLPLSPTLKVTGIDVESSSYFPSNTLPLKINFKMKDSSVIPAIYKVGDDLQQDMLTLQMVRLMDKLWLNHGLDLKMVTFNCIPTRKKRGMIEMVTKADTLRKIQVEHGLTGSFKDKPIAEWLAKHNPSELEYARAVENFTASCAGYCVVTYILGICDRHNDNIMLKTSGHLFHIDFGKFLGDAQMFGNFKRDRAPFVLTSDMAYVINGGDRPSEQFHKFVDLCCQAFNIIRNNGNLFLYIFTLMASSGMVGITTESVSYIHRALLPTLSNPEAAAYFARMIESSLKSWFTQFNFFLHNLAQLRFSADQTDGNLLSFVPRTYSVQTDGRLTHVEVVMYRKRYDPDKYYVYVLRIYRDHQNQPMEIQRTYKEFCELHQKLCIFFPMVKLYSLSTGLHMGRSNIKQVAQKRFIEISEFIKSLFKCAEEIAHSDLVYTFFHPLLRDQQYAEDFSKKAKGTRKDRYNIPNESGRLKGQLKLSLLFSKGVFTVMVHHVRGLPKLPNSQEPSTYVKVYLVPDDNKTTKRKTKVVKKNCHPSFMEMLEYRMPLEIVKQRTLRATVMNYDALQENEFMGGVELDLSILDLKKDTTEWYPLSKIKQDYGKLKTNNFVMKLSPFFLYRSVKALVIMYF